MQFNYLERHSRTDMIGSAARKIRADGTLMAFFPGFPSLLALGAGLGIPMVLVGMLISNVCSAQNCACQPVSILRLMGRQKG